MLHSSPVQKKIKELNQLFILHDLLMKRKRHEAAFKFFNRACQLRQSILDDGVELSYDYLGTAYIKQ